MHLDRKVLQNYVALLCFCIAHFLIISSADVKTLIKFPVYVIYILYKIFIYLFVMKNPSFLYILSFCKSAN